VTAGVAALSIRTMKGYFCELGGQGTTGGAGRRTGHGLMQGLEKLGQTVI